MMRYLALILLMPSLASAQTIIREEITHINGVKLARPIVTYDAKAAKQPLLRYEERILIRGVPVGVAVQTQRPFVQFDAGGSCPDVNCPLPQSGYRLFRR